MVPAITADASAFTTDITLRVDLTQSEFIDSGTVRTSDVNVPLALGHLKLPEARLIRSDVASFHDEVINSSIVGFSTDISSTAFTFETFSSFLILTILLVWEITVSADSQPDFSDTHEVLQRKRCD